MRGDRGHGVRLSCCPEHGANHEILTERQATRVAALIPGQAYPAWVMPGATHSPE